MSEPTEAELNDLKALWQRLLGQVPADDQWYIWAAMHTPAVIRRGVLQTAKKNLSLNRTMNPDYKVRFASKVMIDATDRELENAQTCLTEQDIALASIEDADTQTWQGRRQLQTELRDLNR